LLQDNQDLLIAALGGVTGGFSIKDIWKSSEDYRTKKVIVAVVGAVSGYYVGYWLTYGSGLSCDSQQVLDVVSKEPEWMKIERDAWWRFVFDKRIVTTRPNHKLNYHFLWQPENFEGIDPDERDSLNFAERDFKYLNQRARYQSYDFKSEDFRMGGVLLKIFSDSFAKHPNLYDADPSSHSELQAVPR